jgi:monofunctional biosynthetic peptidoglycan transglycosylase
MSKSRLIWRYLLAGALVWVIGSQLITVSQIIWYQWFNPTSSAFIDAERERLRAEVPPKVIEQTWVAYDQISRHVKRAVLASEDSGFAEHDGVEWNALEEAARANIEHGAIKRGGSTITMQVAKNLFLSSDRSYWRKAQEIVIATLIEVILDKRRILEIYLNIAEWGVGVFGIEAAAQHYFNVPASKLNPWQAAWLAAILPSPKRYDLNRKANWPDRKAQIIIRRMPQVALP